MRKITGLFLALLIAGCIYGSEDVKKLVTDPHFAEYQNNMDELESSYLKGKIKYSEYLNRKKELEAKYSKEVKQRVDIIEAP